MMMMAAIPILISSCLAQFTNYGLFFSLAAAPEALQRALEPWNERVLHTA